MLGGFYYNLKHKINIYFNDTSDIISTINWCLNKLHDICIYTTYFKEGKQKWCSFWISSLSAMFTKWSLTYQQGVDDLHFADKK